MYYVNSGKNLKSLCNFSLPVKSLKGVSKSKGLVTEACFVSDLHTLTIGITQIPNIIYDKCSSRSICVCVNASVAHVFVSASLIARFVGS